MVTWVAYRTFYATFNRWNDERNVNVNRNDNDWNDAWSFAGVRNSLHFSPRSRGVEFCANCPCHPPNIFQISFRPFMSWECISSLRVPL